MAKLTERMVEQLRRRYEAGKTGALLEAIDFCARAGMPLPLWLVDAFCVRYEDWSMYRVKSLDAAFGVERKGARIPDRARRERLKPRVALWTERLHKEEGKPYGEELFELVGAKLNIESGEARALFYAADNPWRDVLRAWPPKESSE
jgi:hypothetical protein